MKIFVLQVGNVLAYLFMVTMNVFSSVAPFNGVTNGDISNKFQTRFTPAGYAFSIWGLIFAFLGIFSIYQALPRNIREYGLISKVHVLLIVNLICNGLWSIIFSYELLWLSCAVITVILITLIAIYLRLGIGTELQYEDVDSTSSGKATFFWCVHVPISMYLGWISVATVANYSIFFSAPPVNWNAWAEGWSVIMQLVVFAITSTMLYLRFDFIFGAVVVWALAAIAVHQANYRSVLVTAVILGSCLFIGCLVVIWIRVSRFLFGRKGSLVSDNVYMD